jgi:Rrf2 family protein
MKITAQEEYGMRCLLQLSKAQQDQGLTVKEIAAHEGLSPAYVEKLLRLLSRVELIHSVRGSKGGYLLNRKPSEISLAQVVRALGNIPTTQGICDRFTGNRTSCIHIDNCCIRSAWATLTQMIETFLERTYLSDLTGNETRTRQTLEARAATQLIRPG